MVLHKSHLLIATIVTCAMFVIVGRATAHPLGNFSVNRYASFTLSDASLDLLYIVDRAEIPAFQNMPNIDTNGDKVNSEQEIEAYIESAVPALLANIDLTSDGQPLALMLQNWELTFPAGQGDLLTERLVLNLSAALPATQGAIQFVDDNFADRIGWHEIVVESAEALTISDATVPLADVSTRLTDFPDDSAVRLDERTLQFTFAPRIDQGTEARSADFASPPLASADRFSSDRFAELITNPELTPRFIAFALLAAFVLGAAHALTPGHGKTIVGAYLVGSRGTAKHALFLGLTTTVTHTAGVFFFGLLVLFASQFVLPDRLFPYLGVASGLLVVLIGASLARAQYLKWRGIEHSDHAHSNAHGRHTHFGVEHSHIPAENTSPGWRSLLALGISGGIIPCPSALVVLLSAIALQRVAFGLLLITIFSFGLASVLTGLGLGFVYIGRWFEHGLGGNQNRLIRVLPIASATFITLAGVGITLRALLEVI